MEKYHGINHGINKLTNMYNLSFYLKKLHRESVLVDNIKKSYDI